MIQAQSDVLAFLETVHPYDSLPRDEIERVSTRFQEFSFSAGAEIYHRGSPLPGIFLIMDGAVEIMDATNTVVSELAPRNSFGERGLLADGFAATTATARGDCTLLMLPKDEFRRLMQEQPVFARFFTRGRFADSRRGDMAIQKVSELMSRPPIVCAPTDTVRSAAALMRERHVSSLGVVDGGRFLGILTTRDLAGRVLAEGLDPDATPVSAVMTADPVGLPGEALGSDILHLMLERRVGHLPVVEGERLVGMITQTDLIRFHAISSAQLIRDIATSETPEAMRAITTRIPQLLVQLVGSNNAHEVVTRLITDIADSVTRRLIMLAERELGPPPVPYVWLACGSQGRQEQSGVSDQDNCIFIEDGVEPEEMPWFQQLAAKVSRGLDICGYFYCPGDMMATNPRWCQPVSVWRSYFRDWIYKPDPTAQMLASVMFDLRPICGASSLFQDLQAETLEEASRNSIFTAHMISNSLKHAPPLGLLRGFATIRSGEHRNQIDMKHNGVVPVVDLGRVYSLIGKLAPVNTRARLLAAEEAGIISGAGARDLVAAYDLIADMRLRNQVRQVRDGRKPDNFLAPYDFGDFERSHLRDAFVVVRTMQSALANGGRAPV
ncbi:MAG: CBS domain-containing protein [Alphaproteobacteria bacterium]|nr:CBS domain-containing protein [Alphaproteobacteria bacterium]MBU0831827.1 CBS domain-containing protein [Alphaproteobacteria bacterium]MBU1765696.1 CBS domain-containing protein [Alphaproteobacteria bacterium]